MPDFEADTAAEFCAGQDTEGLKEPFTCVCTSIRHTCERISFYRPHGAFTAHIVRVMKIVQEWMQPHVRRIRLPDSSVFATEGGNDCSLYILVEGSVMIYKDREVDDHLYTSEITGLDVFQSLFGISAHELSAGDCFGQVKF